MVKTMVATILAAGHEITPVKGKIPILKNWVNKGITEKTYVDTAFRGYNYGVVLSDTDLVIDVDPRNFKENRNSLKLFLKDVGLTPEEVKESTYIVSTGGGGRHIYYKKPKDTPIKHTMKEYPGLEFKTKGRMVVGPGSIHPETGKEYTVLNDFDLKAVPMVKKSILELIKKEDIAQNERKDKAIIVQDERKDKAIIVSMKAKFIQYLKQAPIAVQGSGGDEQTYKVACYGKDLSLNVMECYDLMLENYNDNCEPPWEAAKLMVKVKNAYAYGTMEKGHRDPRNAFSEVTMKARPTKVFAKAKIRKNSINADLLSGKLEWAPVPTKKGETMILKRNIQNCTNFFLINETGLNETLAYNDFIGQIVFIKPAPWHYDDQPIPSDGNGLVWTDDDAVQIRYHLSRHFAFDVDTRLIEQAARIISSLRAVHPIKQYLEDELPEWDGIPRLNQWLVEYGGAKDSEYVREAGAKTILAAVARILSPGIKFDYMLVLEGPQGIKKGTLIKTLGHPWSADLYLDPHSKDMIGNMQGKWFIEVSEMVFLSHADTQAVKSFLSRDVDRVRPAYARSTRDFPRQCIFIGTNNHDGMGYLKDNTGNRRYWVVEVGVVKSIDIKGLAKIRDQLFAEAVLRYKKGEELYIKNEEALQELEDIQMTRVIEDPWQQRIKEWIEAGDEFDEDLTRDIITDMDVWTECLNGAQKGLGRKEVLRINNSLMGLGYTKGSHYCKRRHKTIRGYKVC